MPFLRKARRKQCSNQIEQNYKKKYLFTYCLVYFWILLANSQENRRLLRRQNNQVTDKYTGR